MSDINQLVEVVQAWHDRNMNTLKTIIDTPQATEIRLGEGDDAIVLTGEQAKGFRTAAIVFKGLFEKLPFSIEKTDPDDLDEEE